MEVARYSAVETLRDGRPMEIRALRPDDQVELLAAVERSSPKSRYRRFFGAKRYFSDKEIAYFVNVDFVNHVALVVVVAEGGSLRSSPAGAMSSCSPDRLNSRLLWSTNTKASPSAPHCCAISLRSRGTPGSPN